MCLICVRGIPLSIKMDTMIGGDFTREVSSNPISYPFSYANCTLSGIICQGIRSIYFLISP